PQRRRSMRTITVGFISSTIVMTSDLVWQDRKNTLYSPKQLLKNAQTLLGLTQMMWRLLPDYLAFYKASFHPSKIDQQDLLIKARELLSS
ncbi:MAG: metal-dependent hydrolase, partial [Acinetobacter sp.]